MKTLEFDEPIELTAAPAGVQALVANIADCTEFLLRQWPGKRGDKHRAAVQACMDVREGKKPISHARRAFAAAAREAGLLSRT